MPGGGAASLRLSTCIACIPSWLGTSTAHLGRGFTCLGGSTAGLGLSSCAAHIHPLQGISASYLGRTVSCLGNSAVCLGISPQLGISTVCLRGVTSPDLPGGAAVYLGRIVNGLGRVLSAWE